MVYQNISFTKGRKKREELQLPVLLFAAADDWIDKLGHDAFCSWLKLYSWCDRSESRGDKDNDVIPTSFNKVMARLGVGRKKFYNSIIRPLWNYGLIDIMEYENSNSDGQKPMNIIVYEHPQNDITKQHQPLEKIRDYDTEYFSAPRTFAKKGGRKKANLSSPRFHTETGGVSHRNRGGFTQKPNNDSNIYTNDSNIYTNDSNKNLSIEKEIQNTDLPPEIQKTLIKNRDRLIDSSFGLQDVVITCNAFLENTDIKTISYILDTVLVNAQTSIKNFRNYFSKSLNNYYENLQDKMDEEPETESDEIVPEWFKQQKEEKAKQQTQQHEEVTDEEWQETLQILREFTNTPNS